MRVIARISGLPARAAESLASPALVAQIENLRRVRKEATEAGMRASDALFDVIGAAEDAAVRGCLLRLRRAVFKATVSKLCRGMFGRLRATWIPTTR